MKTVRARIHDLIDKYQVHKPPTAVGYRVRDTGDLRTIVSRENGIIDKAVGETNSQFIRRAANTFHIPPDQLSNDLFDKLR